MLCAVKTKRRTDVTARSGMGLLYVHLPLLISWLQQWVRSLTPEEEEEEVVRVHPAKTNPYVTT